MLKDLFENPKYLVDVFNKVVVRDSDTKYMDFNKFPRSSENFFADYTEF